MGQCLASISIIPHSSASPSQVSCAANVGGSKQILQICHQEQTKKNDVKQQQHKQKQHTIWTKCYHQWGESELSTLIILCFLYSSEHIK